MTGAPLIVPCRDCRTATHACHACGQYGWRRARLVLTVANLDTGAVASFDVVPAMVEPRPTPGGGWHLPLTPLLRKLAGSVGAASFHHVSTPTEPPGERTVALPRDWRPELPVEERHILEAEALAGWTRTPWQVFLGRTAARPAPDPDRQLARLCAVADLLCLDLVVEARRSVHGGGTRLGWDVRYELPGAAPPERAAAFTDLPRAVAATTVEHAIALLTAGRAAVPAYFVGPAGPAGAARPTRSGPPPIVDLDQVERRVVAGCQDLRTGADIPGSQAIWRNEGWWYTGLRPDGRAEPSTDRSAGPLTGTGPLRRGWEPPAPCWRGAPIPYVDCPDCDPAAGLRACDCTLGGRPPEPGCARCGGTGRCASALSCHACGGSRRRYLGAVVTISDLRDRVIHLNWQVGETSSAGGAGDAAAPQVASQPNGQPVVQLSDRYRPARWAGAFRVRPADLADLDGSGAVDQDLRDAIVTLPGPEADPLTHYLAYVTRARPGARRFVRARRPEVPPLADLIRLVLGLDLAITVTVQNHRHNEDDPLRLHGEGWDIEISAVALPVAVPELPVHPTIETAIADCLEYLDLALAEAVPADPAHPIPVPSAPESGPVEDPTPLLARLGDQHAGQPVAVRYDRSGCHLYLRGDNHTARHLVSADHDLDLGIRAQFVALPLDLVGRDLGNPHPDDLLGDA